MVMSASFSRRSMSIPSMSSARAVCACAPARLRAGAAREPDARENRGENLREARHFTSRLRMTAFWIRTLFPVFCTDIGKPWL